MKTKIMLRSGFPSAFRDKAADVFSAEEIDRLDVWKLAGLDKAQLSALRQKLADTYDRLEPGDCGADPSGIKVWKKRLDKLNDLMEAVDEMSPVYIPEM